MRVLYFSRDYTPHDHRFLNAGVAAGHEMHFLRLERGPRQTEDRPLPPGVELQSWEAGTPDRFGWTQLPARILWLRRILRAVEPDLVHAGPVPSCAFLAALAQAAPLVSMSWGSDLLQEAQNNFWMRRFARFALRRSDWLLADCAAVRDAAAGLGFPLERVTIFPWGVDLERFSPAPAPSELRSRLGWQDAFVVLSLRSWEPVYGVETVVEGFARAALREPRLRLLLLSGGSLAPRIQQLLARHQLHDRVHLGGQISQNDLPRYYQAADLYLSASRSDGSSISLLEAMASGLPALVSDIPGNREWVRPDETGSLFPAGDAGALADALLAAAALPLECRAAQRTAARALAEARADWSKNVLLLNETYRKVIA